VEAGDSEPNSMYIYDVIVINQIYISKEEIHVYNASNAFVQGITPVFSYTFFEIRSQLTSFISKNDIKTLALEWQGPTVIKILSILKDILNSNS
jgi:hypothetical protein